MPRNHTCSPRSAWLLLLFALLILGPSLSLAQALADVPKPRFHIVYDTLGIYGSGFDRPEDAKPYIEQEHLKWPWWNGGYDAARVVLYCPAVAAEFRQPDFTPAISPEAYSTETAARPIQRQWMVCSSWGGSGSFAYCNGWSCGPDPYAHAYSMKAACANGWAFTLIGGQARCDCPAGYELVRDSDGHWRCRRICTPAVDSPDCYRSDRSCPAGNPILPGLAVKVQQEVDYEGAGAHALHFTRTFRSNAARPYVEPGRWSHWVHTWGRRIDTYPEPGYRSSRAYVVREDATQRIYTTNGAGSWVAWENGDRNRLIEDRNGAGIRTGFRYVLWADDSVEYYDVQGRLIKVVQRNGWTNTLSYSTASTPAAVAPRAGLLISVRNHFGRELRFTYDSAGRLAELLPPGAVSGSAAASASSPIRYRHAEAASLGAGVAALDQPTSVVWQDGNVRRYHYEHAPVPGLLTGITDELGVRIGTYGYTATGRATRTEGPAGTNVIDIVHWGTSTDVIDRSGATPVTTTYRWQEVQGVIRPLSVSGPCPLCGSSQASTAYTATGEVARSVGHDGKITFFSYDSKGRETERAEFPAAYNSATTRPVLGVADRVVTTQWHATWNLPLQRAEPGSIQW